MLIVNITYHASTRLMEIVSPSTGSTAGTTSDNDATKLSFTFDDTGNTLNGYVGRVEFDVALMQDHTSYKPFIVLDEQNSVVIPNSILSAVKCGTLPIQLAFVNQDNQVMFSSLNILNMKVNRSIGAMTEETEDRIPNIGDAVTTVDYDDATATFTFNRINGTSVSIRLSDLAEDHFEVATYDDLITLSEAENGDTATTLDDGRWYKLYGVYSELTDWKVMPGGATQNGSPTTSPVFYAPEVSGTAGQYLQSAGPDQSPVWDTLTKEDVGLSNVDNTSDLDKPVSTAQQNAINTVQGNLDTHTGNGKIHVPASSDDTNTKVLTNTKNGNPTWQTVSANNPTLAFGQESTIGTIAGTTFKVTMPANPDTDRYVIQTLNSDNTTRPLLFSTASTSNSDTDVTNKTFRNNSIYANPSTGSIYATKVYSNNSEVVNLADAQTITGTKTYDTKPLFRTASGDYNIVLKAKSMKISDNVTGWTRVNQIQFTDSDETATGYIQNVMRPIDNGKVHEIAIGVPNASGTASSLWIRKTATGNDAWLESSYRTSNITNNDVLTAGNGVTLGTTQTITGLKTINSNFHYQNTSEKYDTVPSAHTQRYFDIIDEDGNRLALFEHWAYTGGSSALNIFNNVKRNNIQPNPALNINVTNSGTGYIALSNQRTYDSNNTADVVTIGSLQASTDVVHTSGNETVGGIKTFMSNPVSSTYSGGFTVKSIDQTQASISTQRFLGYDFVDSSSNNLSLGSFGLACRTTGTREVYIQAVSTGGTSQTVRVFSLPNGSGYAVAPARAYANAVTTDGASDVLTKAHLESAIKIGGEKTFTGQIFRMNPSADVTVTPTNNQYWGYVFVDKNNKEFGGLRVAYTTNKDNYLYLALRDIETDQQTSVYSFYKTHSTFPTRAYNSSNTMDVVTIGSLQASTDVVHTSGNETIGGVKTFTANPFIYKNQPQFAFKDSAITLGTTGGTNWQGINIQDSAGTQIGQFGVNYRVNLDNVGWMSVKNSSGSWKYLNIYALNDGTSYVTAPNRSYASASSSDVLVKGHVADMMSANVGNGQISFTSSRGTAIDNFTVNQSSGKNIVLPAGSTQYQDEEVTFALQSTPDFSDYPYMASKSITGLTSDMYATVTFSDAQVSSGQYAPFCQTLSGEIRLYAKSNVGAQTIPTISVGMDDSSAQQSMSNFVTLTGAQTVGGTKTFTNDIYVFKTNPALRLKQNTDVYTTTPSGNLYAVLGFHDKNDAGVGGLSTAHYTNGNRKVYLDALGENGTKKSLELYVEPNGTSYMNGPYRTYSASNTSDVVTIGSLQASTDVVHQTGNESVNGVKDFKGTLMSNGIFSNKCAQNIESTSIWRRLYYTSDVVSNQVLTLLITSQKGTIFEGGILIIYGGNSSVNMSWLAKGIDTVTSNYVVVQRTDGIHEVWVRNVNGNRGLCAIKLNETNWGSPSYYWVVDATTTSSTFDPTDTSKYSVYAISS